MSLAAKYRPKTLDEVLGQTRVVESLKTAILGGRHHAFLFTGPSGVGKTTLARILANEFANGRATEANIEEVNAAENTGVDSVRAIIARSYYRAVGSSSIKSIIVDECHRLSGGAWDALLKPIEHPPSHVYWVFCTTNPDKLPKTINTRCLKYNLSPLSEELILKLLVEVCDAEGFKTSDEILEIICDAALGSPRQALVFLELGQGCERPSEIREILRSGSNEPSTIELSRWLASGRVHTWAEATKYVKALEGKDAESIRITVVSYLTAVLLSVKDDKKAALLLSVLEPFLEPYTTTDKLAPLLHSIGLAIGLDRS